jgi:hypothetical protein
MNSQSARYDAQFRRSILLEWELHRANQGRMGIGTGRAAGVFCSRYPWLSLRTLQRWASRFREGGIDALKDGRRGWDSSFKIPQAAQAYFRRIYSRKGCGSVAEAWRLTRVEAERRGWPWPSLRTVQDRVHRSNGSGLGGRKDGRSKPVR